MEINFQINFWGIIERRLERNNEGEQDLGGI